MSSPRAVPRARPAETEEDWARAVVDYARFRHWERYHPKWSIGSPAGWPDETLCRPPRLVFAELKSERGKVTPSQQTWLGLLAQVPGVEVYVWRPSDWPDVERILK
jgi:hypothetical protein